MAKLSYCVLSYNRKEMLSRLLQQLQQTRIPESEIIVVDNGSTDGTSSIVPQFQNEYTKFILNKDNTGVSKGWNTLVKNSQSPLPCIFNDDYEVANSGWENIYLDTLQKVCGIMSFPRSIGRPQGHEIYNNWIWENGCKYTHNFRLFAIPRVIYDQVGGFDEQFMYGYEDTDLNMASIRLGYPLLEMNTDKVHLVHLKDLNKPKDLYDVQKELIHSSNLHKNNVHFYSKWPHGL